mmetsp:Transcript_12750/g.28607  ORF Transcript_12750/g.28607 Transcript_12750/m.28607 type:complete len:147 (-) Transcript_12750:125-565(-)
MQMIISSALDRTIQLSNIDGESIGTFSPSENSGWTLGDQGTWIPRTDLQEDAEVQLNDDGTPVQERIESPPDDARRKRKGRAASEVDSLFSHGAGATKTIKKGRRGVFAELTTVDNPDYQPNLDPTLGLLDGKPFPKRDPDKHEFI